MLPAGQAGCARSGQSVALAIASGSDPHTRRYIDRRMKEGLTKKEAFRCLKRYIAREVYNHLPANHLALDSP